MFNQILIAKQTLNTISARHPPQETLKRDLFQDHSDPCAALVAVLRYLSFHWFCSRVKRLVQGEGEQENATSYVKEQL